MERPTQMARQITPGMEVCDVSGEKVGSVIRVQGDVVEVKTGRFGFGKHLYVQPDAVDGITEECVILKHPKQEFHDFGLDVRPDQLMA